MSMIRQIGLIILAVVALAIGGSVTLGIWNTRQVLQQQWETRNADSATLIALALSQHHGEMTLMELVLSAQFDTGHYRRVRLVDPTGATLFERESPASGGAAPLWFIDVLPMKAPAGQGIVTDGWRTVGRVQVEAQAGWAYDSLWAAMSRSVGLLLLLGVLALVVAAAAVGRWRRGLDDVVAQAHGLEEGRFTEIALPATRELKRLASGMNSMVRRLHGVFDAQAEQVQALRRQVLTDGLTGLSNRRHFTVELERALRGGVPDAEGASSEAPPRGGLLIVRLRNLDGLNERLGRAVVDRMLAAAGEIVSAYPGHVEGAFAGRLNGGDLALFLPATGMTAETAQALRATLGTALTAIDRSADIAIGGVDGLTTGSVSVAMSGADEALARAEFEGPFGVHIQDLPVGEAVGESEWRQRISDALAEGRARIAEYPVVDAQGTLLHLECPLRVQVRPDGPFDAALRWLPMATRSRLVSKVDLAAAELALGAIAADGRTRCIHVAAQSIADPGFVQDLTDRLAAAPASAARLSIEVGEAVTAQWHRWRAAVAQWRPFGVKLGLENAGGSMHTLLDARNHGLDYMKIDGRFVRGLSREAALADYARQIVVTARAIGVAVYAEGLDDPNDLARLWELGFDGATGPAVASPR